MGPTTRLKFACLTLLVASSVGSAGCNLLAELFGGDPVGSPFALPPNTILVSIENESGLPVTVQAKFVFSDQDVRATTKQLADKGRASTTTLLRTVAQQIEINARVHETGDFEYGGSPFNQPGTVLLETILQQGDDYESGDIVDIVIPAPPADCNENGTADEEEIATGDVEDCDTNGVPDVCEGDLDCDDPIDVDASPDQSWIYERLLISEIDVSDCAVNFTASIRNDPLDNSSYSVAWFITPPADRTTAAFTPLEADTGMTTTWLAPERPAFSPGRLPYLITAVVTGDQHGNRGTATFEFHVRLLGDVNDDGCTNAVDEDIIHDAEDQLITDADLLAAADINCSGHVDVVDAQIAFTIAENFDGHSSCLVNQANYQIGTGGKTGNHVFVSDHW